MDEDIRTAKRNDLSDLLALYDELPLVLQFLKDAAIWNEILQLNCSWPFLPLSQSLGKGIANTILQQHLFQAFYS